MSIKAIAAMDSNRVIGFEGDIPWKITQDLKRFKSLTLHQTVVMGRKTFTSLRQPLVDRENIVVTSRPEDIEHEVKTYRDIYQLMANNDNFWVIGGGMLYESMLPYLDEIWLTVVDGEYQGDVHFPEFEEEFYLVDSEKHPGWRYEKYVRL